MYSVYGELAIDVVWKQVDFSGWEVYRGWKIGGLWIESLCVAGIKKEDHAKGHGGLYREDWDSNTSNREELRKL